jgi:hypothetical protein
MTNKKQQHIDVCSDLSGQLTNNCLSRIMKHDLWLFPKIKSAVNLQRVQDIEDIQKNVTMALKTIPQQEFQTCFQQ